MWENGIVKQTYFGTEIWKSLYLCARIAPVAL